MDISLNSAVKQSEGGSYKSIVSDGLSVGRTLFSKVVLGID